MINANDREKYNTLANLLDEAITRLREPRGNFQGNNLQASGIYWRCCKIVEAMDALLEAEHGCSHAFFIRKTHGVLIKDSTTIEITEKPSSPPESPPTKMLGY